MAITDINISEQLETSAPSIKYEGNEGPQSPQEERMVAQLKQEYMLNMYLKWKDARTRTCYVFRRMVSSRLFEASKMGVDAGQQPQQPQQPQPK